MEKYRRYIDLGYFSILLQKKTLLFYIEMWTRKIELFLIKIQSKLILAFEAIRADSLIRLLMEFSQKIN